MIALCYHDLRSGFEAGISTIDPVAACRQLDRLSRQGLVFAPLDSRVATVDSVAVSFDDAYASQIITAMEILHARAIQATVFVPTDFVGGRAQWDYRSRDRWHADWDLLRCWCAAGHAIGSHGASHSDLRTLPDRDLERELLGSRKLLEARLGRPVRRLAYPFGRHDRRVRDAAARAGYTHGYTTAPAGDSQDPLCRPRIVVSRLDTPLALEWRIRGTGWGRLERGKQRLISFWSGGTAWQQQRRSMGSTGSHACHRFEEGVT